MTTIDNRNSPRRSRGGGAARRFLSSPSPYVIAAALFVVWLVAYLLLIPHPLHQLVS